MLVGDGDHVVDVILLEAGGGDRVSRPVRAGRTPGELFAEFLAERELVDERLLSLFDELLDESSSVDPTDELVTGAG